MNIVFKIFFVFLHVLCLTPSKGQNSPTVSLSLSSVISPLEKNKNFNPSAIELINEKIDLLQKDPVLRNADWGLVIYDPKTRNVINSYNESYAFTPASTTKLLTTETAVSLLGTDFVWCTQLEYSGTIENGILRGDLYLVGSGDPTLGTNKAGAANYASIVFDFKNALKELGIREIQGNIVLQTAVFKDNLRNTLPENMVWLEREHYYLPVGSASMVDPKKEKRVIRISAQSKKKNYFYVSPYTHEMVYTDSYDMGYILTKLPEPPIYLANSLRQDLVKSGIVVDGKVITKMLDKNPESRIPITKYKSPPLKDIIYYTNQRSDNSLAEALLRMLGFQCFSDQTLESGRLAVTEHLRNEKFDFSGLVYHDGSGLSRTNKVTPIAQVKFLSNLMNKDYFPDFFSSLPIAGQTGTLKRSFLGSGYGQIFAKTGTLNKVKTLAGYLKTYSKKTLVFSLMINNYAGSVDQVKSRMEQILGMAVGL
ncbi:MAG: D-alanyl-D-alanine carboxypeptidase/D-alanyl-D-alanine-endopeptidase [Bergeyella sp.]|nr:D-alanyl-D-alanine carboxypeptidase/D-alanyl-D-alanine-endopeptidase [Bergeyella sp.]